MESKNEFSIASDCLENYKEIANLVESCRENHNKELIQQCIVLVI